MRLHLVRILVLPFDEIARQNIHHLHAAEFLKVLSSGRRCRVSIRMMSHLGLALRNPVRLRLGGAGDSIAGTMLFRVVLTAPGTGRRLACHLDLGLGDKVEKGCHAPLHIRERGFAVDMGLAPGGMFGTVDSRGLGCPASDRSFFLTDRVPRHGSDRRRLGVVAIFGVLVSAFGPLLMAPTRFLVRAAGGCWRRRCRVWRRGC